jgi:hypothetical protein
MYQAICYQSYFLLALVYLSFSTILVLKLLLIANLVPISLPPPNAPLIHAKINSLCNTLHKQAKGAKVLLFAWAGVKVAVYSRLLGTLGVCWVAGNLALVQRTAKVHFDVDILASILAVRRRVLSAVVGVCSRFKQK